MPAGNISDIVYWYVGLDYWEALVTPPQVLLDTEFHLGAYWRNLGTARAAGHIDGTITKPDGTEVSLVAVTNQDREADPGKGFGIEFSGTVLDQPGSYQGEFILKMMDVVAADGVSLVAGWNYDVTYLGPSGAIENAVASILPYLGIIWVYRDGAWLSFIPPPAPSNLFYIYNGELTQVEVTQDCFWSWPTDGALPETVAITITNKNAPANAVWWAGLAHPSVPQCPFTPMSEDLLWTITPNEVVLFICYDANYQWINTVDSGMFLGWGTFKNGETYTWNFATGMLEGNFSYG